MLTMSVLPQGEGGRTAVVRTPLPAGCLLSDTRPTRASDPTTGSPRKAPGPAGVRRVSETPGRERRRCPDRAGRRLDRARSRGPTGATAALWVGTGGLGAYT